MPAITFIKKTDLDFNQQLKLFTDNIDTYATGLGLTPSEVNSIKADALYYNWVIKTANLYKTYSIALTSFKKDSRKGKDKNLDLDCPPPPVPDPQPTPVKPNIEFRFSKLVKKIKSSRNYATHIGEGLGIEAVRPHFDVRAGKPKLSLTFTGNHVVIKYKRGKYEGVQIWKNAGDKYVLLSTANHSKFIDESELPPQDKSVVWKYKAVYLYKDKQVGQWSDEVTITVMGFVKPE